jgi:hypothetical protein
MQYFTCDNSGILHDDSREPVKIPGSDWFRLPPDQRDALGGCPYVLSGAFSRQAFVRAILL